MVSKILKQGKRVMSVLVRRIDMRGFIDIMHRTHVPTCLELSMFLGGNTRKALLRRYWTRRLEALRQPQEKLLGGRTVNGNLKQRNTPIYQLSRLNAAQARLLRGLLEALRQRYDD